MISGPDLLTVGLLVALEGLLSADNALVMAVIVLGLPRAEHAKALKYGLIGAFVFRIIATLLAAYLIQVSWVKLLGGVYLLYLTYSHFSGSEATGDRHAPPPATPMFGLSPLWATVVRVEFVNLAFSIDSILVAVAMSPKRWVVIAGGVLGIVAMRAVVGQLIKLVERYPPLVDGAFVIIGWVGIALSLEYLHTVGIVDFEVSKRTSLALIGAVLLASYLYARVKGPVERPATVQEGEAAELLASDRPQPSKGDERR